jgi:hypothetical protein
MMISSHTAIFFSFAPHAMRMFSMRFTILVLFLLLSVLVIGMISQQSHLLPLIGIVTNQNLNHGIKKQETRGAFVYLTNERHIDRGRSSCPSLYSSLESLWRHFPRHEGSLQPPVVIMIHDEPMKNETQQKLRKASPFPVKFFSVNLTRPAWEEKDIPAGMNDHEISYQRMCAFWFHTIFELDFLPDYMMRLDTDSCLTSNMTVDPFQYMLDHKVDYMYHSTFREPAFVIVDLKNFTLEHPGRPQVDHSSNPPEIWHGDGTMDVLSTNLEWMYLPAFCRPEILEWKGEIKMNGGIYRHRWGDAPLRRIVATKFLNQSKVVRFCPFSYNHSVWNPFEACDSVNEDSFAKKFGWTVVDRKLPSK